MITHLEVHPPGVRRAARIALRLLLVVCVLPLLPACQSLNRAAKPRAAQPSGFLAHSSEMKAEPKRSPFIRNWTNPSPTAQAAAKDRKEIYIAPVDLAHLRRMSKIASRVESNDQRQEQGAKLLAEFARQEFRDAFTQSPKARYRAVNAPDKNSLTLELSIIELNPNSISAGVVRTAVNVFAVPGVDTLIGGPLKANIAIEGRLSDSRTHESIYEFADRQESQSSLVLAFRDFMTYAQGRQAIRAWARQFEELTRTPASHRVGENSAFIILPW